MTEDSKESDKLKSRGGALPSKRLVPGERIVWEGRPTWITFLMRPGFLLFLSIIVGILAFMVAGHAHSMSTNDIVIMVAILVIVAIMVVTDHHRLGILLAVVSFVVAIIVLFELNLELLALVPILLGILVFLIYYLIWSHIVFALTDRRLMSQYGIFSLRYADTQITRVQNVTVIQPWWERALGYGDVMFATAGERGGVDYSRPGLRMDRDGTLVWEDVPRPFELRKKVEEILYQVPAAVAQSTINPPVAAPATTNPPSEVEARLLQLQQMKDKGLINEAEYEAKRKEILSRL